MRVLVTGGAGYVGSHTVERLLADGHTVWVYDNLSNGHRSAVPADRLIIGDCGDDKHLEYVLVSEHIDAVIHFAAFAYVGESMLQPEKYYHNNVVNTLMLLSAMRRSGVGRLVFSSTCATYGIPARVPIREEEAQCPVNPYGQTKLIVERVLHDYAGVYEFGYAALRYFNAAGASASGRIGEDHHPETHLIPLVLQTALGQRPHVQILGDDYETPDGTCIRDYVHVADLAEAHVRALTRVEPGARLHYNLGTGTGSSVRQVIERARDITGARIPVQVVARRTGDPPVLVACADRAYHELAWQARHSDLGNILESAWRWYRTHPQGYGDRQPFGPVYARAA